MENPILTAARAKARTSLTVHLVFLVISLAVSMGLFFLRLSEGKDFAPEIVIACLLIASWLLMVVSIAVMNREDKKLKYKTRKIIYLSTSLAARSLLLASGVMMVIAGSESVNGYEWLYNLNSSWGWATASVSALTFIFALFQLINIKKDSASFLAESFEDMPDAPSFYTGDNQPKEEKAEDVNVSSEDIVEVEVIDKD